MRPFCSLAGRIPLLLLAMSIAACVAPARADDDRERRELLEDIEDALEEAADELEDVAGASSSSPVSSAQRYVESIPNLVDKLARVKGDDSTANRIVDRYKDYVGRYRDASGPLTRLKDQQPSLRDAPRVCEELDRGLASRITELIDKKDPKGVEELTKLAESLRVKADDKWRDAEGRKRELDQYRDQVKRFGESDNGWADVRTALHRAADDTFGRWESDLRLLEQACANLRRGTSHPKVEEALKMLAAFSQGREQIIKEAEAAIDAAAQLLNGAAKDDSDDDIEAALNKAGDIAAAVTKLGVTKGNDPRANDVVDKWPAHITAYKAALAPLLEIKRAQFGLDGEVKKCQAADQALVDYVAQYKDAAGIVAIEQKATEAQKTTNDTAAKWKEQGGKMDGWNTDAQRLQISDGKWTYLSGYVRSAAQGSVDHWKAALKAAETACENLGKGTAHPKVEQAIKMLKGRIPPSARHASKHDSTCTGVPAGGFCMANDQCLDGECSSNKCTQCPSRDDGRCHPPGTCSQSEYDSRRRDKESACGKPFNSDSYKGNQKVDCDDLGDLCNNAQACVRAREVVQQCFRGGDTRHMEEFNTVRASAAKCEALLKEKREKNLCE